MRVLLTGVPGWLGNRFLEILVKESAKNDPVSGWDIRCLCQPTIDISHIHSLASIKSIEVVRADVSQRESLNGALKNIDVVFHMVGIIHPQRIKQLYEVNTLGTRNILRAAYEAGVKKFVYISSNSVGGMNVKRTKLMSEDDPPNPYLHYGRSKYQAECSVNEFYQSGKLKTVILRPCWYYGPHQPERQTRFLQMIKKGNPIVFGSGDNLRSMSYVDNVCQAMISAAQKDVANGKTYWIADERPYRTIEIYQTVADLLGVRSFKPRYVPDVVSECCAMADSLLQRLGCYMKEIHVAGEMNKDIACSIQKAKTELGYAPKIELKDGMNRSIEWCRNNGIEI